MVGGTTTFAAVTIPLGVHTVSTRYVGDAIFAVSTSNVFSYTVSGFTITPSPGTLTFTAGATTANTTTLTYTSVAGFSGAINQACIISYNEVGTASYPPTCSYFIPTVTLSSGGTATSTLTIASTLPHLVGSNNMTRGFRPTVYARSESLDWTHGTIPGVVLGAFVFCWFPTRTRRSGRHWRSALLSFLLGVGLMSIAACSSGSAPAAATPVGTTAGSYTITLTSSSGNTSASPAVTISLNIN